MLCLCDVLVCLAICVLCIVCYVCVLRARAILLRVVWFIYKPCAVLMCAVLMCVVYRCEACVTSSPVCVNVCVGTSSLEKPFDVKC